MEMTVNKAVKSTLVHSRNPFLPMAGREVDIVDVQIGMTVNEVLRHFKVHPGRAKARLTIDGKEVKRQNWSRRKIRKSCLIQLQLEAEGGGSNPLQIVLSIALMMVAPQLGMMMPGATEAFGFGTNLIWGDIFSAVISFGGKLLIGALMPPPTPKIANSFNMAAPNQTYSVTGMRNNSRPFQPLPLVYGRHRMAPDFSAKPSVFYMRSEQWLFGVFCYGVNDIATPTDHRIGDTGISAYVFTSYATGSVGSKTLTVSNVSGVAIFDKVSGAGIADDAYVIDVYGYTVTLSHANVGDVAGTITFGHIRTQWAPDGAAITLVHGNVETQSVGVDLTPNSGGVVWSGDGHCTPRPVGNWVERTGAADAEWLQVDIVGRAYAVVGIGDGVSFQIQYRPVGTTDWIDPPGYYERSTGQLVQATINGNTADEKRISYRWNVPVGQYDVRVRAYGNEYTARAEYISRERRATWSLFSQGQSENADFSGQNRLGVMIKASGNLSGTLDNFSSIVQSKCWNWDGSAWIKSETRNPAWAYLDFILGKRSSGKLLYGVGLYSGIESLDGVAGKVSRIDIDGIKAWATFCDANNLKFDAVIDSTTSCADVLNKIARAGRGAPSWATGTLGVVWEEADSPVVAMFGMFNIRKGSFNVTYISENITDEIEATFVNADLDYQPDTVRVKAPGVTSPVTATKIDLFGITDAAIALQDARLIAASQFYHRRRIQWETDIEGLLVKRGDVVQLSHDLTQWHFSGRIVAWDSATRTITLDREVDRTSGDYINLRWPNGYFEILPCSAGTGTGNTIVLQDPLPTVGDDGTVLSDIGTGNPVHDWAYQFAPVATPGKRVRIVGMRPLSQYHVQIEAVDDEPGYYTYAEGVYTPPVGFNPQNYAPSDLSVSQQIVDLNAQQTTARITLTWNGVSGADYVIRRRVRRDHDNDGELSVVEDWHEVGGSSSSQYQCEAVSGDVVDFSVAPLVKLKGSWGIAYTSATVLAYDGISDIQTFLISGDTLEWSAVDDPFLAGYEIRYQQGENTSWNDAIPLHYGKLTASPYLMTSRPSGSVTFMIKAFDTSGGESVNPAIILTDMGDPIVDNVVASTDYHALGFTGVKTNASVEISSGDLVADVESSPLMWNGDDSVAMWVANDQSLMWSELSYKAMIYVDSFTVSSGDAGAQITLDRSITADNNVIYYRRSGALKMWSANSDSLYWSTDSNLMWSDEAWRVWPGSIKAEAITYEFKVTTTAAVQGRVSRLVARLDMPTLTENFDDVSVSALGTRLAPLVNTYRVIKNVSLTLQDDGGSARTIKTIDKSLTGPLVKAYDSSGLETTAIIDATIQGY